MKKAQETKKPQEPPEQAAAEPAGAAQRAGGNGAPQRPDSARPDEKASTEPEPDEKAPASAGPAPASAGEPSKEEAGEAPPVAAPGQPGPDAEKAAAPKEAAADEVPAAAQPAGTAAPADELARLRAELQAAYCLNAAYAAGVRGELAGDAATLAAAEAGPDADANAARKAVDAILKRHPEWKAAEESDAKKAAGGFQLGADPGKAAGTKPAGKADSSGNKKRWNRFK